MSFAEEPKSGGPPAVDRVLKKNASDDMKNYDTDAHAIAKVLVRHYGDEADAVLRRTIELLSEVRRTKQ